MKQSETVRSFTMAAWLGWQVESNWTDPFLFAIYVIIKPLATAAILVVMYSIITGGDYNSPLFPYIYLGNAFYTYVGAVMAGPLGRTGGRAEVWDRRPPRGGVRGRRQ